MDRQPISKAGYDKLKKEIKHLEDNVMPEIAEKIAEARAEGDLKENTEYHGQRDEQGRVQAKINMLKSKLGGCYIADASDMPKDVVAFGAIVSVNNLTDGFEEKYQMVGPGEESFDGDIIKIVTSSPVGSALMDKKVGDIAEAEIPVGIMKMEILSIEYES